MLQVSDVVLHQELERHRTRAAGPGDANYYHRNLLRLVKNHRVDDTRLRYIMSSYSADMLKYAYDVRQSSVK